MKFRPIKLYGESVWRVQCDSQMPLDSYNRITIGGVDQFVSRETFESREAAAEAIPVFQKTEVGEWV